MLECKGVGNYLFACTNASLPFGNLIFVWLFGNFNPVGPAATPLRPLQPSHSLLPGPESAGSGRALSASDSGSELPSLRVTVPVTESESAATEACHGHGDWPGPRATGSCE